MLKTKQNRPSPENFLTIGGYFEHYTYCVTALGWLKKDEEEERKRRTILTLNRFRFATLKYYSYYTLLVLLQTGAGSKLLCVLLDASICSPAMISLCKC